MFGCDIDTTTINEGGDEWEMIDQIAISESVSQTTRGIRRVLESVTISDAVNTRLEGHVSQSLSSNSNDGSSEGGAHRKVCIFKKIESVC